MRRERDNSLYSLRSVNSPYIVKIAGWRPWFFFAKVFLVKSVSRVRSYLHYFLTNFDKLFEVYASDLAKGVNAKVPGD